MKIYQEVTRTETFKKLVQRVCDLCKQSVSINCDHWGSATYDVNETKIEITIKQREGSNYPEGGSGTEIQIDLCPKCFKERLVPWLSSQGATIKTEEWDW